MKVLGMNLAPANVPLERRLQTLAALGWILTMVVGGLLAWLVFLLLLYFLPLLRLPLLLYVAWYFIYDKNASDSGRRRSKWVRNWTWWRFFRDFFPAKLVKTADLPSDKNYLMAVFPHGILSSGAFCAFATDHLGFSEKYPGLSASMVVLTQHFTGPIIRELALTLGCYPAPGPCLTSVLSSEEKGKALALMVGGAQESLYTKPGVYKFYLLNRKGFVKVALESGASLVPVICFGEPDLYDQVENPEGSWLRKTQEFLKKRTGVAPILFLGRGIFQYSFGIIPQRHALNIVVGKPIDVEKTTHPSTEQVDILHQKFVESLRLLFEEEKEKFIENAANTHLTIV